MAALLSPISSKSSILTDYPDEADRFYRNYVTTFFETREEKKHIFCCLEGTCKRFVSRARKAFEKEFNRDCLDPTQLLFIYVAIFVERAVRREVFNKLNTHGPREDASEVSAEYVVSDVIRHFGLVMALRCAESLIQSQINAERAKSSDFYRERQIHILEVGSSIIDCKSSDPRFTPNFLFDYLLRTYEAPITQKTRENLLRYLTTKRRIYATPCRD